MDQGMLEQCGWKRVPITAQHQETLPSLTLHCCHQRRHQLLFIVDQCSQLDRRPCCSTHVAATHESAQHYYLLHLDRVCDCCPADLSFPFICQIIYLALYTY